MGAQRILEQHDQRTHKTSNIDAGESYREQQHHTRSGQVKEDERENELPESGDCRNEPDEPIHDPTEHERGYKTKGKYVEEDLD
jgi:hypothetical protein